MARLTRNSYKRKIIMFGIFIFAAIALISTGFAAWVMSTNAKDSTGPGNVSVGTVTDASLEININNKNAVGSFIFEPSEGDITGRVRVDETGAHESLKVTLTGTVAPKKYLKTLIIKLSVVETDTNNETKFTAGIKKAAELGYIDLPKEYFSETGKVIQFTGNDDGDNYSINETISFAWGKSFEGVNPSIYYDENEEGKKVSDDEVKKTLEDLRACIYGYYDELYAQDADREQVIKNHANDTAPQFIITIEAKTN